MILWKGPWAVLAGGAVYCSCLNAWCLPSSELASRCKWRRWAEPPPAGKHRGWRRAPGTQLHGAGAGDAMTPWDKQYRLWQA